jgi:hypothetical protein
MYVERTGIPGKLEGRARMINTIMCNQSSKGAGGDSLSLKPRSEPALSGSPPPRYSSTSEETVEKGSGHGLLTIRALMVEIELSAATDPEGNSGTSVLAPNACAN